MPAVPRRSRSDELRETCYPSDPYTAVKHAVYRRYTQCWMGKILRSFPDGAAIVDGFCGAGTYTDGLDGSPLVFAKTFIEHSARKTFNMLDVVCLDERADRLAHLASVTSRLPPLPRLRVSTQSPGSFADRIAELAAIAHRGDTGRPVLWVLDPYGWADASVDLTLACLAAGPRDEVIVSVFTQEMYRWGHDATKHATLTHVTGGDQWRRAFEPPVPSEASAKEMLADAYRDSLRSAGFHVGKFAVAARGRMPRYHLIYATQREQALQECWLPTVWYLDSYAGGAAGPIDLSGQGDLFGDQPGMGQFDSLRARLETYAGEERSFRQLLSDAAVLGFKETHLRQTLTRMRDGGLAVRVDAVGTRSPWPSASVVRFYNATDSE